MSILMDILRQYTGAAYSDLTSVLRSRINIVLKVDNIGDSIIFPVIPGTCLKSIVHRRTIRLPLSRETSM